MYQHGKRVHRPHNYKILLATVGIIGTVVLGVWFMIHEDIGNATGPKSNVPIVSNIGETSGNMITIIESLFTFQLPADWRLKDQVHTAYRNSWTWAGTKKGGDDRSLTLHVDIMPQNYKLVKILPVSTNGDSFLLGTVSDDCVNFAGGPGASKASGNGSNEPFPAKWQDVTFVCDPISSNQTIGTGSRDDGISVPLKGANGRHTYFFYFEDHNIRPDSSIFSDAVDSFRAK